MVNTSILSTQDISTAGGQTRVQYVPLGDRYRLPRTKSSSNGFGLITKRFHTSPNTDIIGLVAVHSGMEATSTGAGGLGLQPLPNDCNVATTIMASADQSGPGYSSVGGASRSFRYSGNTTGVLKAGDLLMSDPLAIWMPKNTSYIQRSWITPVGGTGVVPYGIPLMGYSTTGGSLSGIGTSGIADGANYNANSTDITQTSSNPTGGFAATTGDACYEPVLLGISSTPQRSWLIIGDSISAGSIEFLSTSTLPGAGDPFGNTGHWERACKINNHSYWNVAIPGASGLTLAKDGYFSHALTIGALCCDSAIVALGTNDLAGTTSTQILTMIQKMVNICKAMGIKRIVVATIPPRVNTVGAPITDFISQTENTSTPWPWATINSVNASIRAGAITGAIVADVNAIYREPTNNNLWRVDGGAWTYEGTHPTIYGFTQAATQLAPVLLAA